MENILLVFLFLVGFGSVVMVIFYLRDFLGHLLGPMIPSGRHSHLEDGEGQLLKPPK